MSKLSLMIFSDSANPTPYFAVIFTSIRDARPDDGYAAAAARMEELARLQPGFLGIESARGDGDLGITVSYWASGRSALMGSQRRAPARTAVRPRALVRTLRAAHLPGRTRPNLHP